MSPGCLTYDYPSAFSTENCRLECVVMEAGRNASRTHSKPPWRTLEWITTHGRHLHRIGQHGAVQSTKEQQRTSNNVSKLPRPSEQPGRPVASTLQRKPQLRCPALTVLELSGLRLTSSATFEPTQSHGMNDQWRWSSLSKRGRTPQFPQHRFIIGIPVHFGTRFFSANSVFLTAERPTLKHRNDVICCVFQYKFAVTFICILSRGSIVLSLFLTFGQIWASLFL